MLKKEDVKQSKAGALAGWFRDTIVFYLLLDHVNWFGLL